MNKYNINMPNEIINYCIVFMFLFREKFDSQNIGKYQTLNGNVVTCIAHQTKGSSSFLSNTVSKRRHIWRFKLQSKHFRSVLLGIWKANSGKPPKI